MSKWVTIAIIVLFVPVLSLFASYSDTVRFQIDFELNNNAYTKLQILPSDDSYTLDQVVANAEYRRSFISDTDDPLDKTLEYDICKIHYESNIGGRNHVLVEVSPLYSVNLADNRLNRPLANYVLNFYTYGLDENSQVVRKDYESLNMSYRTENVYLLCDVDDSLLVGDTHYIGFDYYLGAIFTDLDDMSGRYTSTLTIGVIGL